jgi:hypothetical protein
VDLRAGAPGVAAGWAAGKTVAVTFEIEQAAPTTGKEAIGHLPATGYLTFHDLRVYTPPPPQIIYPPPAPAPAAQPAAGPRVPAPPAASSPSAPASVPALQPATGPRAGGSAPASAPAAGATAPIVIPAPLPVIKPPEPLPERVIPAGTAVLAHDGQRFFTQAEARLTPSSHATVPIVAEYPGRGGNLPTGAIERIEDGQKVDTHDLRVANRLPTYGGTDRQEAVVAAEDRAALRQALEARAMTEAPARLFAEAGTDHVLIPETTNWTLETQYDYAPGQRAAQLQAHAVVRAQAVGVPHGVVEELAARQWRERLPDGVAPQGKPRLVGAPALQEQADHYLVVALPVQGPVTAQLDPGALAERLRGQPIEAMKAQVASLPGLRDTPEVAVWPAWAPATLRVDVVVAAK